MTMSTTEDEGMKMNGTMEKKMGGCQFYLHCVLIFLKKILSICSWPLNKTWIMGANAYLLHSQKFAYNFWLP